MHEMSIVLKIIDIATDAIPDDMCDVSVEAIHLRVGKLTAIVPSSLNFCFNIASRDTPLAGAKLEIEEIPIVGECAQCGAESTIDEPPFSCRQCGNEKIEIISGRELLVTSIEVADEGAA